jgi:hypothetical protein
VLATWNSLSTFTVTTVPSALRACASSGDPAESVPTRRTVPPGTALSAAAFTLVAVPSVSSVSPGPCFIVAESAFVAAADAEGVAVEVYAPAMFVPASALFAAATRSPLRTPWSRTNR